MIQSFSLNFNTLQEMRDYLMAAISNTDVHLHLPPYMNTFYHPLRKKLFQSYQPLQTDDPIKRNQHLYQFIQIVDEEILNLYQMQLSKPYQDLIMVKHYGIPNDMDVEKLKHDNQTMLALTTLVSNIAEWNIQIERTVDSIVRVQLYQLWVPEKSTKDTQLNAELKSLLAPQDEFNFQMYSKHILMNLLSQGAEKFGKFLYSNGISQSNLSYGAVLLIYQAFVGKAALPWAVILPSVQLKWLFGGLLGSLALGKISSYLDKQDQIEQVYGCGRVFQEITTSLVEFNENLTIIINECLLTVNENESIEKRRKLKQTIDKFLEQPEIIKEGEVVMITSEDIIKHEQDEWQILK